MNRHKNDMYFTKKKKKNTKKILSFWTVLSDLANQFLTRKGDDMYTEIVKEEGVFYLC